MLVLWDVIHLVKQELEFFNIFNIDQFPSFFQPKYFSIHESCFFRHGWLRIWLVLSWTATEFQSAWDFLHDGGLISEISTVECRVMRERETARGGRRNISSAISGQVAGCWYLILSESPQLTRAATRYIANNNPDLRKTGELCSGHSLGDISRGWKAETDWKCQECLVN